MSGIEEMKKKTKLSMDEMYDALGNDPQKSPPIDIMTSPPLQSTSDLKDVSSTINQTNDLGVNLNGGSELNENESCQSSHLDSFLSPTQNFISKQVKIPKPNTYKMTFVLTEEIYKKFNQYYAQLIYEGRPIGKSDMLCDAIATYLKSHGY